MSLHTAMRSSPRRLVLYWLISTALVLAGPVSIVTQQALDLRAQMIIQRQRLAAMYQANPQNMAAIQQRYGSLAAFQYREYPGPRSFEFYRDLWYHQPLVANVVTVCLAYVLWPWVALLTLMVLRASMRKAKVRAGHVMRCTIYSADPFPALAGLLIAGALPLLNRRVVAAFPYDSFQLWMWWSALILLFGVPAWRLWQAYRRYLRFDHAAAVVLSVEVIFVLLLIQFIVSTQGFEGIRDFLILRRW